MLVGAYARCVWLALPASAVYLFRESREREAESMWRTQTEECVGSPEERRVELDNRTGDCARARRVGVRTRSDGAHEPTPYWFLTLYALGVYVCAL